MNVANNKRKKDSQEKIEKVFIQLIQDREINEVSVSDICKEAGLNRSTFYANYVDIYELAEKIRLRLINEMISAYEDERISMEHSYNFLKLFRHIKENQIFYNTYFKLGFDILADGFPVEEKEIVRWYGKKIDNTAYHIEFFKSGLNAVIKKWLKGGCKESPEEINEVIVSEYAKMR